MYSAEKFESIPKYSDFKFKFTHDFLEHRWIVYDKLSSDYVGEIVEGSEEIHCCADIPAYLNRVHLEDDIGCDFERYKKRPEYFVFYFQLPDIKIQSINIDILGDMYETIFVGASLIRAMSHSPSLNPDDAWPQIDKTLKWLRTTDFFRAPASSIYHDSYEGGLCYHSLKVAQNIIELMNCKKFSDPSKFGDAIFCALVHDWCKIDMYESYARNVKNDATGRWEAVQAFRHRGHAMINLGHGVSSMYMASKFFKLTIEEACAIRWHMGAYRTSDAEFDELQTCNEQFPLVHLLQFADQLSLVKF